MLGWALLCVVLCAVAGCASDEAAQRKQLNPGQTELRIASFNIIFKGEHQFDASTIKSGLVTQEDPGWRTAIAWMPLIGAEPEYFNEMDWDRDVKRIQTFYASQGYFNASIVSTSIVPSRQKNEVRITIQIAEGEPTKVGSLDIEGLEPLEPELQAQLTQKLALAPGEVFTQDKYLQTRRLLLTRLKRASFAYAQITGRAVINPQTRAAQVQFFLDPGPRATFGKIYVVGNEEIETRFIREALTIEEGQPYSAHQLDMTQADIYDMGVFSLVSVIPAHEASDELIKAAKIPADEVARDRAAAERNRATQAPAEVGGDGSSMADEAPGTARPGAQLEPPHEDDDADDIDDTATSDDVDRSDDNGDDTQDGELEDEDDPAGIMGISDLLAQAQSHAEARTDLDQSVPIIVRVKDARLWNVEVGAGLSVATNRSDVHALANWSSQNFLGGLRKLEHFNTAGYAWASNDSGYGLTSPFQLMGNSEAANHGVFLESRLEFRQPQFLERLTTFKSALSLKRNIEVGYTVWNPQGMIGVERRFFRHLTLELNYNLSYFKYHNVGEALLTTPELGSGFAPDYLLEYLEQRSTLDLRDDPFNPTSGYLTSLSLERAGSYIFGGDFDFWRVSWANQGYVPFHLLTDWVLAARFQVGALYNTENTQTNTDGRTVARAVPIESRFYAGGAGSLRGLGRNNLSYFRVAPFDPSNPGSIKRVAVIQVGGVSVLEASLEPRFRLMRNLAGVGPLWGVLFYDVATVLNQQLFVQTDAGEALSGSAAGFAEIRDTLVSGVGGGAYWITPVGPVRADFAVTLNDLSNDPRFRLCGPFANVRDQVSETGRTNCDYLPDERDPVVQQLNLDYSFFIGIGHSF